MVYGQEPINLIPAVVPYYTSAKIGGAGGRYQDVATVSGQPYKLTFWGTGHPDGAETQTGKVQAGTPGSNATDLELNNNAEYVNEQWSVPVNKSADDWIKFEYEFTPNTDTTRVSFQNLQSVGGNTDAVNVDLVSLTPQYDDWVVDNVRITLPELGLNEAIAKALGRPTTIRALLDAKYQLSELAGITTLNARYTPQNIAGPITDLTGIHYLVNLRTLDLSDQTKISAADLAEMLPRKITSGSLEGEPVGLAELRHLNLTNNSGIDDITVLGKFTKLETLRLEGTEIQPLADSTLSVLGNLPSLTFLTLPTENLLKEGQDLLHDEGSEVALQLAQDLHWRVRNPATAGSAITALVKATDVTGATANPDANGTYSLELNDKNDPALNNSKRTYTNSDWKLQYNGDTAWEIIDASVDAVSANPVYTQESTADTPPAGQWVNANINADTITLEHTYSDVATFVPNNDGICCLNRKSTALPRQRPGSRSSRSSFRMWHRQLPKHPTLRVEPTSTKARCCPLENDRLRTKVQCSTYCWTDRSGKSRSQSLALTTATL